MSASRKQRRYGKQKARQVVDNSNTGDHLQSVNDIDVGHYNPDKRLAANDSEIPFSLYKSGELWSALLEHICTDCKGAVDRRR